MNGFHCESPIGVLRYLLDTEGRLTCLIMAQAKASSESLCDGLTLKNGGPLETTLQRWFSGDMNAFDRVELAPEGTEFQKRVWRALCDIPAGETRSYGEHAAAIGKPNSVRAVANANGRNPISLVIPCHRVIGADGSLTGYAGGLARKQWLLAHEQTHCELTLRST